MEYELYESSQILFGRIIVIVANRTASSVERFRTEVFLLAPKLPAPFRSVAFLHEQQLQAQGPAQLEPDDLSAFGLAWATAELLAEASAWVDAHPTHPLPPEPVLVRRPPALLRQLYHQRRHLNLLMRVANSTRHVHLREDLERFAGLPEWQQLGS